MWESGDGRSDVPAWSNTQVVIAVTDGTRGSVVSVDETTISVWWPDIDVPVVYPKDALAIRKPYPWE